MRIIVRQKKIISDMRLQFLYLILNYNTYNDTMRIAGELMPSLGKNRRLLIVDNASPNGSYGIMHRAFESSEYVDVIINNKNEGFAKGNNLGLRYAKKYNPKYVCIINNDVHFDNDLVARLALKYDEIPDAGIIAPIQLLPGGARASFENLDSESFKNIFLTYLLPWTYNRHVYKENSNVAGVQSVFIVPGAFLFADYERFESIGFFYEGTFLYCEESFLGARVKKAGFKNYIVLNESYIHEHGKTINTVKSRRQQQIMIFKGRILYAKMVRKDSLIKLFLLYLSFLSFLVVDAIKQPIKAFIHRVKQERTK